MKVHLIDGTYELFRMFYGAPKTVVDGREVGATRQFARSLLRMIQKEATHIGVAFDHVIESFRNDLFDGYKTGEGIEPLLRQQFELVEEATKVLGIVCWPLVEFEADDGIASAAFKFRNDAQIIMCSPDKDLAQCVRGDQVVMRDRLRKKTYNEAGVLEKFGVMPTSIPDYLALVGDAADGIPGIPKWGAKGASAVLKEYGSLENIPADFKQWTVKVRGAEGLSKNLEAQRKDALLYKKLAILREDVPIAQSLDEMKPCPIDKGALAAFCEKVGDPKLLASAFPD